MRPTVRSPTRGRLRARCDRSSTWSSASLSTLLDADSDGLNDHWEGHDGARARRGDRRQRRRRRSRHRRPDQRPGVRARLASDRARRPASWPRAPSGTFFAHATPSPTPTPAPTTVALRLELDGGGIVRRDRLHRAGPDRDLRFAGAGPGHGVVLRRGRERPAGRRRSADDVGRRGRASPTAATPRPPAPRRARRGSSPKDRRCSASSCSTCCRTRRRRRRRATVRYLLPSGAPVVRTYELPAQSRTTIVREHGARPRVDRRVGRDHGDAADRRRAGDVSQQRRPGLRARPRRGGGGGAVGELVLRRGRDRRVLRHLPAAGQSVGAAGDGAGRLPARPGRRRHPDLHGAGQQPLQRLRRRRAGHGGARPSARASRRRCRSSPSARCTGPAGSSTTTRATSRRARPRPGSHWVLAGAEQVGAVRGADVRADRQHRQRRRTTVRVSTLPETGPAVSATTLGFPPTPGSRIRSSARRGIPRRPRGAGGGPSGRHARPAALVVEGVDYWSAGARCSPPAPTGRRRAPVAA